MMQYRDGRRNDPVNMRLVQHAGPQFGQLQGSSGPNPPSLQEVLAERGFDMPERPTGFGHQAMVGYKDPVTGKMSMGGAHDASHARLLGDFYGQNPEALELAKQYNTDPTQFGGKPSPTKSLQQHIMPPIEMIQRPGGSVSPPADLESQRRQQPQPVQRDTMARESRIPQPQPVQQFQPIQRPSFQSLQQPMEQQQPQFNQQGMQQMMQMMQQMMQMFSMMSGQGGRGGFGGGFNQRPPMFGGGFGGGFMNQGPYGGGFGQGGYQQPRQRPMPSYPRMQNNYSQDPFGGY